MKDIRILQSKALLPVSSVAPVRGFTPPSIMILGDRFDLAEDVTFNGISVGEFIIASRTRIMARVPDSQVGKDLVDLQVLSSVQLSGISSLISLGIQRPISAVSGVDRLAQEFLLVLYTTPGSDIFSPESGGGLMQIIGRPGTSKETSAAAELSRAIDRTRQEIMRTQAAVRGLPPEERLLSVSLSDVAFDENTTTLSAVVDLKNVLGETASVNIG